MNTSGAEAHSAEGSSGFFGSLALVGAGSGSSAFATITAFVLFGVGRNVLRVGLTGPGSLVSVALFNRVFPLLGRILTLFLLSGGCHNISSSYPSIEATDMPFAEALM
jgi:hypothetical protein